MSKRALVVDDDAMIRDVVTAVLTADGFEVVQAENGRRAVEFLDAEPRPINIAVIILDVMMPEMNGLDVLTHLKLHDDTRTLPVLMLTGEDKNDDIMAGYNCGADYYITKPFTRQQLRYGLKLVLADQ